MSKVIEWDKTGEKLYETGVDHGVLYPMNAKGEYVPGVAWNGISNVNESPSGAEATPIYADNIKYLNLFSAEDFGATIQAYTYPDEFESCDGSASLADGVTIGQQARKLFGFSYRTLIGNDVDGQDHGTKTHLVYGCQASPSEKSRNTVNESPEATQFSWTVTTTPVAVTGFKPTAHLVIDSTKCDADKLAKVMEILYGKNVEEYKDTETYEVGALVSKENKNYKCKTAVDAPEAFDSTKWEETNEGFARLPLPDEVAKIFANG